MLSIRQFNDSFDTTHLNAVKRVLHYLKGTLDLGYIFKRDFKPLSGYVDADWGIVATIEVRTLASASLWQIVSFRGSLGNSEPLHCPPVKQDTWRRQKPRKRSYIFADSCMNRASSSPKLRSQMTILAP